ncbi:GTP cyclohydrolase II [Flavobacterium sp. 120]|uniref:GTP cyclohydrolase II n=1 Tax=Flavobacterium sp. 120 TaxID=2135626 RepID=UPI000EB04983|nr:GTP cyclohydrolase II [Flavobacterium sp. 120]RKS14950.1 3,4-dihydroxy 2-butanone 4-phosphate synthase/GTP cyclohydrolase II [Flavobacterium sp. 120]
MNTQFEKAVTRLNTHYGDFDFYCYSWGQHEEDNILCLANLKSNDEPLIRVQSACYTAEIFRSLDCDCHEQLDESIKLINLKGGMVIYMLCDGRGAGLLNKVKGLELGRTEGLDTSEAYHKLNIAQDPREYSRVVQILDDLNIKSVKLLTNNPRKIEGLISAGIKVTREPLEIKATETSKSYLETKTNKMGHLMNQFKKD